MTITLGVYEIAALIIALAFLALILFLIPALIQVRRTVKEMEDLTSESKRTVESLNHLLKKTGAHADDIEELVKKVREVGLKYTGIAETVADNIKSPVISLISILLGLEGGLKRLFRKDKDKEGGGKDVNG